MRSGIWRGNVELRCKDGTCLGEASARLASASQGDEVVRWCGELRAAIRPTSIPWPAGEPVRLRFGDGEELEVWLEPDVLEQGPVLLQWARVSTPSAGGSRSAVAPAERTATNSLATANP